MSEQQLKDRLERLARLVGQLVAEEWITILKRRKENASPPSEDQQRPTELSDDAGTGDG